MALFRPHAGYQIAGMSREPVRRQYLVLVTILGFSRAWPSNFQAQHANQLFFQLSYRQLSRVLFFGSVVQRIL
jgi:hypothetical protein